MPMFFSAHSFLHFYLKTVKKSFNYKKKNQFRTTLTNKTAKNFLLLIKKQSHVFRTKVLKERCTLISAEIVDQIKRANLSVNHRATGRELFTGIQVSI